MGVEKFWFKLLTGNERILFYQKLTFYFSNLQLESSSEARSALENQLERLTRDKVCVDQFCLFIVSRFAVLKSCFVCYSF